MGKEYVTFESSGCSYLTAGKAYKVISQWNENDKMLMIINDIGSKTGIVSPDINMNCGHIGSRWQWCEPSVQHVRPVMTPEARDILDSIHETIGAETRSESIVKFMEKNTEIGVELCAVKVQLSTLEEQSKRRIEGLKQECESWIDITQGSRKLLVNERKRVKGWMIYSAIVAVYAIGVSIWSLMQ